MENVNGSTNNEISYELDNNTREKMSQAKQGAMNPNYGKPRSPETIRKISDSMKNHHQNIKAFNEALKLSCTKRVWDKVTISVFKIYNIIQCHDLAAIYSVREISNEDYPITHRVYYYNNDVLSFKDFDNYEEAEELYLQYLNPKVEILVNECRSEMVVLGFLKGTKIS